MAENINGWSTPAALALPKEGYFNKEDGRYGPIFPQTPANYGFTVIAKLKPGKEDTVLEYGKIKNDADLLNILLRHTARQQETHRRYMQRLDELTHKLR